MVTMYVADGLRAPLVSVKEFAEDSQQISMEEMYVAFPSLANNIIVRY